MKACSTCDILKPFEAFNKKKQCKDGLASRCKECKKEWEDKYYERTGREKKAIYKAKNKEAEKARCKEWQKNNQGIKNFHTAKYRALKKKATPKWLTKEHLEEIKDFYKKARELTEKTGTSYHVDHVHPLQGKNFNGLHVPWNLQIITKLENLTKSNNMED